VADRLIPFSIAILCAVLGTSPAASAGAVNATMVDPTRPYASPSAESEGSGGGLVLQSVMISPVQRVAIISGRLVRLGDQVGGATVVNIAETEVALKDGTQVQTLRMYPGVNKQQSGKMAPAKVAR